MIPAPQGGCQDAQALGAPAEQVTQTPQNKAKVSSSICQLPQCKFFQPRCSELPTAEPEPMASLDLHGPYLPWPQQATPGMPALSCLQISVTPRPTHTHTSPNPNSTGSELGQSWMTWELWFPPGLSGRHSPGLRHAGWAREAVGGVLGAGSPGPQFRGTALVLWKRQGPG